MKIRYCSDIHLEFGKFKTWPKDDCKDIVLVLAGDIGVGLLARQMVEAMCKYYYHVVLIAGNHEYYNNIMSTVDSRWANVAASIENLHYLQSSTVVIDDTRFIGGTMWTSLQKGDWWHGFNAAQKMNDYRIIKYYNKDNILKIFDTFTSKSLFARFKVYLESELLNEWNGKTVIVTHHAPCEMSVDLPFKSNSLNCAYYEDMTNLMFDDTAPDLWIHGHMHNTSDYTVGKTRIVANPRGYIGRHANLHFNPAILLEL